MLQKKKGGKWEKKRVVHQKIIRSAGLKGRTKRKKERNNVNLSEKKGGKESWKIVGDYSTKGVRRLSMLKVKTGRKRAKKTGG